MLYYFTRESNFKYRIKIGKKITSLHSRFTRISHLQFETDFWRGSVFVYCFRYDL